MPTVAPASKAVAARTQSPVRTVIPVSSVATKSSAALTNTTPALTLAPGKPLAPTLRRRLEQSFGADLSKVQIQSNPAAAKSLGTKAFALGKRIVLGSGAQPDDLALMAHEVAHTIQQSGGAQPQRYSESASTSLEGEAHQASAAASRGDRFSVTGRTTAATPQGLFGIDSPLDFLANKANLIPGFRMFTILLGVNPINMSSVERSAANVLRALIEFIPGGGLITEALDNNHVFEKVGQWVNDQVQSLGLSAAGIKKSVTDFISSLGASDLLDLSGAWERAKRIFTEPIERIITFAKSLASGILKFIKDAILIPIAKLAEGTPGYDLLKGVMGKDPITDAPVERTAENLVGPFMKLIGQEEIWENMKKANAIPRAWAWFQAALAELKAFVAQIPALFVAAFLSLELVDIILVPRAFAKLVGVFGGFLTRFTTWAGKAVWNLLELIFEVVAPGAMPYLKKVGGAIKSIFKNPIPFVGNLVKAGKLGFEKFAANIGTHLKNSMIEWLTGSLPGVYIPKALEIKEILKMVLSVLGLTWTNIRQKLVKAIGETAVKALEIGFDLVKTLITEGPAAAWEHIKDMLSDLKDTVMKGIIDFVVNTLVKKAVIKVVSLLIPGAAFIQAIITIYDTIMVFVDKLKKIIQVVMAFLDSMMAIASGVIEGAAAKIEGTLAGLLTLAISFLAGFAGLGKVADKVLEIIKKIRAPVDKALDKLIDIIVKLGSKIFGAVKAGVKKLIDWWKAKKVFSVDGGEKHTLSLQRNGNGAKLMIQSDLTSYKDFINGLSIPANKQTEKSQALTIAGDLDKAIAKAATKSGTTTATPPNEDPAADIDKLLDKLATATAPLFGSGKSSAPVYGPLVGGFGSSVRVEKMTKSNPGGSEPSVTSGFWGALRRRQLGGGTYYVRGHLLNHNIGGPGTTWDNLTPLTQNANNRALDSMLNKFETPVKTKAGTLKSGESINFVVTARYGRTHPLASTIGNLRKSGDPDDAIKADIIEAEKYVPQTVECSAKSADGKFKESTTITNTVDASSVAAYQLTAKPKEEVNMSKDPSAQLMKLKGITSDVADLIVKNRPYNFSAEILEKTKLTPSAWDTAVSTPGFTIRIRKV